MDAFQALAEPNRRAILDLLAPGELPAGDIARQFSISPPAVSQHLKTLKEAGLVHVRIDAQRRIYSLNHAGLNEVRGWIARVDRFWTDRLDALEAELRNPAESDTGTKS